MFWLPLYSLTDISRLLADPQKSSLRSQQALALVNVVSRGSGAWSRRSSPFRSPSRSSPSRRRRRESGSPARLGEACALRFPGSELCSQGFEGGFLEIVALSFVCLGDRWEVWESWGADPWVMEVLCCGYRIPFRVLPSLSTVPIPLPSYSPSSIRGIALNAAVIDLVAKGAVEPAPSTLGFYSRLFVTHKVTRGLATGYRSLAPQPVSPCLSFSHGDGSVSAPVSSPRRLDGVPGSPGSGAPVISALPEVLRGGFRAPVPSALLRSVNCLSSVHAGHGPYLLNHAPLRVPNFALPGRLARPRILVSRDNAGEGLSSLAVSGAWRSR